jgi:phosphatidate cytidylyltransferase
MSASGELARRLAVAAVGIPVVLLCLLVGGWVLGGLLAVAAVLGAREYYVLARARGERPFALLGMGVAGGLVLLAAAGPTVPELGARAFVVLLAMSLLLTGGAVWLRWPGGQPMAAVTSTIGGVLYVGATLAFVPLLRALPEQAGLPAELGPWQASAFVILPLATTWVGDSTAYFVGRAVGRTKLAPMASPGKTVEGGVAGLMGSVAAAGVVAWWGPANWPLLTLPVTTALWVGALLGAAAQVGDLAESVLKREAGVKDSGTLLPGHGGVLDRLDALLFALPVTWFVLVWAGVAPGFGRAPVPLP